MQLRNIARSTQIESGQALAEYALIVAAIAMGCLIALLALGPAITQPFTDFVEGISP